jgi:hypothetical protein
VSLKLKQTIHEALWYKSDSRGFDFLNLSNPSSRTMALEFTQSLTEMSTRNRKKMFLGSKARQTREADNHTAICEPII